MASTGPGQAPFPAGEQPPGIPGHSYMHVVLFWQSHFWIWFVAYLAPILLVLAVCQIKDWAHRNAKENIRVPVENFHKLYFWTTQYHCVSRFCFQAQLPIAGKFLDWCHSRERAHTQGIPVPPITIQVVRTAHWPAFAGLLSTAAVLTILQKLDGEQVKIGSRDAIIAFFLVLLITNALLLVSVVWHANKLEVAAVHWVITTALHALSPVELAFGVATGIRLHTFQQALQGKGPDASEEWGDMSGSGQEDGCAIYNQSFTKGVDPLHGVAALYPGDLPVKTFATGIIMVCSSIGIFFAKQTTDITSAVIAVVILYLGTAALFMQYVFNINLAAEKIEKAARSAYEAAGTAYWVPRMPKFATSETTPQRLKEALQAQGSGAVGKKLGVASLCSLTARQVTWAEFGRDQFPGRWRVLWQPIQSAVKHRPELPDWDLDYSREYCFSPEGTLEQLLRQLGKQLKTWPWPSNNLLNDEDAICGERKVLISDTGYFAPDSFTQRMGKVVLNDLVKLAAEVEAKATICAAYSRSWWLAQANLEDFTATVTKYRSLVKEKSYACGIAASLGSDHVAGRIQHRLYKARHANNFLAWVEEHYKDSKSAAAAELRHVSSTETTPPAGGRPGAGDPPPYVTPSNGVAGTVDGPSSLGPEMV